MYEVSSSVYKYEPTFPTQVLRYMTPSEDCFWLLYRQQLSDLKHPLFFFDSKQMYISRFPRIESFVAVLLFGLSIIFHQMFYSTDCFSSWCFPLKSVAFIFNYCFRFFSISSPIFFTLLITVTSLNETFARSGIGFFLPHNVAPICLPSYIFE